MKSLLPRALFISCIVVFSIFNISSFISFPHCKIIKLVNNDTKRATLEKVSTAYHEAGHVIVAHYLKNAPKIVSVTIVPKQNYLGKIVHEFINKTHATKDEFLDYCLEYGRSCCY